MSIPSQASRHHDYLDHMLEAIKLARSYVDWLSKVDFLADTNPRCHPRSVSGAGWMVSAALLPSCG
jgi:hypothetical protein